MSSHRIVLLALPLLLMLSLPPALAVVAVARAALLPPGPNMRLIAFDGLHLDGSCAQGQAGLAVCRLTAHLDSRFETLHQDPAEAARCRALQAHYTLYNDPYWQRVRLGNVRLGVLAPASNWWGDCSGVTPRQLGVYVDVWFEH